MKILIVAVHFEVTGARYITDAFKRLGHDVRHVGPEAKLEQAWGISVPAKYEWKPDSGYELAGLKWIPDLIILADTLVKDWQPFDLWYGTPITYWTNDNHVRNVRREGIDHYFLAHFHGPAQPVSQPDETWLPCGFDPTVFTPSPISWAEREYDVALVGVMYPARTFLLDRLEEAGLKVFRATGLVYEDCVKAYHNSRISLCVSAAGDVAQRIFETAAMGCLVLTDPLLDLNDEVKRPELGDKSTREILGLSGFGVYQSQQNPHELVQRVKDFITLEPDLAEFGAKTLQAQVLANHSWDKRAQVVVDWYERIYGAKMHSEGTLTFKQVGQPTHIPDEMSFLATNPKTIEKQIQLNPYLNLGCGLTHLPGDPPLGHEIVDPAIYSYPLWTNVDKVEGVGADKVFDLFKYPWPLEDNSFDGALLGHICEHIPHEIRRNVATAYKDTNGGLPVDLTERARLLESLQDGWYAFFSELYRVLTPGAVVHIVSPYGWSDGGITDPSHTRYLTINTFTHSMTPSVGDGETFRYNNGGINLVMDAPPVYRLAPMFKHLGIVPGDLPAIQESKQQQFGYEIATRLNVCYDFYVRLKVVK